MAVDLKEWENTIEVDMFIDSEECKPLVEEIKQLRAENNALKVEIAKVKTRKERIIEIPVYKR